MVNFEVIELRDNRWMEIVNKSAIFDFYHTQSYHQLNNEGRPIMFVAFFDSDFIALPLIIRAIPETENLYDCTSAYGYVGPIFNKDVELFSKSEISFFTSNLKEFFEQNNVISAFSRLNPLINCDVFFSGFGKVKGVNKTVIIKMELSEDDQEHQYRKSIKYDIRQLRKKDFIVEEATSDDDIEEFIAIYKETMDRVNAAEAYYFDTNYFYSFLKNSSFDSKLLLAKKDGEIVAGAIFTITGKIMQYHLAGTKYAFIKDMPMKLILDEARKFGNTIGIDYLHLGGGVGGSDEDSLYKFKAGFSHDSSVFKIWSYIPDKAKYDELVKQKFKSDIPPKVNFFPIYRFEF